MSSWKLEGKGIEEYLKKGDKFYKYTYSCWRVNLVEIQFVGFVTNFEGNTVAIFLKDGSYESINYFWRDLICTHKDSETYPDGWYKDPDECLEKGIKFYTDQIKKSKL